MPAASPFIEGKLTTESRLKLARLKHAEVMPALRKTMRASTNPLVSAVRRAARDTPSTHSRYKSQERGGSLRSAVANTVTKKMKFNQRNVFVLIKQVPKGGKSNLGRVLEGSLPWAHPTYGHKPEVTQDSHPFFYNTIEKQLPRIEREMNTVLKELDRLL